MGVQAPHYVSTDTPGRERVASILLSNGESPDSPLGFFWYHLSRRDTGWKNRFPMWFPHYHPAGMKELAPNLAFSDAILAGGLRYLVSAWQGWNSRLLIQPCWHEWRRGHSFFLWCLARVEQLLSKNFLFLYGFFRGPLAIKNRLLGLFLCPHLFAFMGASFLGYKSGIYESKRKSRPLSTMLFLGCWGP